MPHSDTPTAAQIAQLLESMSNQKEDMREVKATLSGIGQSMIALAKMQANIDHHDEKIRTLFGFADRNRPEVAQIDRRVAGLEKWNKILGVFTVTALGLIGWGLQSVSYLYRLDTRVQMLELISNNTTIERSLERPRIEGPK